MLLRSFDSTFSLMNHQWFSSQVLADNDCQILGCIALVWALLYLTNVSS